MSDNVLNKIFAMILTHLIKENPFFILKFHGFEGYAHQVELFYRLALRQPIKALIADEIGLGKTIETLLIISWGLQKGIYKNVLILVPRSLIGQWEIEAKKMGIEPITDLQRLEGARTGEYKWRVFLFKIDTVKRNPHMNKLLRFDWDMIVVDEVHNLGSDTQRFTLVRHLATKNPKASILLLSATPHRGDEKQFRGLLSILISREVAQSLNRFDELINTIIFRRRKDHVNKIYEDEKIFVDAKLKIIDIDLKNEDEKNYINKLVELTRDIIRLSEGYRRKNTNSNIYLSNIIELVSTIIMKRGLSSPEAGQITFEKIIKSLTSNNKTPKYASDKIEKIQPLKTFIEKLEEYSSDEYISGEDPDKISDVSNASNINEIYNIFGRYTNIFLELEELADKAKHFDSKIESLKNILINHIKKGEKIIIFTEFADTAKYIYNKLNNEKLSREVDYEIKKLTGEDFKSQGVIEEIKKWLSDPKPKILISTDVASEGLNLQYANVIINYELPWSLVKLEQRIGRVWRLGQKRPVTVYLLVLNHKFEKFIFEALYRKIASSIRNMILPSALSIIESEDDRKIEIPIVGVYDHISLSLNLLLRYYAMNDEKSLDEYINSRLKTFKNFKNIFIYTEKLFEKYDREEISDVIRKASGFSNQRDFNEFIRNIIRSLQNSSKISENIEDIKDLLKNIIDKLKKEKQIYASCDSILTPLVIFNVCLQTFSQNEGLCWIYAYSNKSNGGLLDIRNVMERISMLNDCEEIQDNNLIALINNKLFDTRLNDINTSVENLVKKEILRKLLNEYLNFINYVKSNPKIKHIKDLSYIGSVDIDSVEIKIQPLIYILPKKFIGTVNERIAEVINEEIDKLASDLPEEINEFYDISKITEEKLEIENIGREILEKLLYEKYDLLYIGDTKAPFDYVAKDRITGKTVFIELKTLRKLSEIYLTNNEKEFGERLSKKFSDDKEYWIYVVDLSKKEVRGYKDPFKEENIKIICEPVKTTKFYRCKESSTRDYYSVFQ